jgi:signal transduction histidine kinase
LAQRVRHLAQTRAETIDASAAEIRRIERDLHDGAQARLVAMGMTLGAAEDLLSLGAAAGSRTSPLTGRNQRGMRSGLVQASQTSPSSAG